MRLVVMTDAERAALDAAQHTVSTVRAWRRYQAVRLFADGREAAEIAAALGCCVSSVYDWAADWRAGGEERLAEGLHAGRPRRLDATAEEALKQVLADDPQVHGYRATDGTVPLLSTE